MLKPLFLEDVSYGRNISSNCFNFFQFFKSIFISVEPFNFTMRITYNRKNSSLTQLLATIYNTRSNSSQ